MAGSSILKSSPLQKPVPASFLSTRTPANAGAEDLVYISMEGAGTKDMLSFLTHKLSQELGHIEREVTLAENLNTTPNYPQPNTLM